MHFCIEAGSIEQGSSSLYRLQSRRVREPLTASVPTLIKGKRGSSHHFGDLRASTEAYSKRLRRYQR